MERGRELLRPNLMGQLPGLWEPDASVEDWQAVFDLVRSSWWAWEYEVDSTARPLPAVAEVLPRPDDTESVLLRVRSVPGVQVNFWPMSATEIDFDMNLRELQGRARVDTLYDVVCAIGRRLGKPVFMCAEGQYGSPSQRNGGEVVFRRLRTPMKPNCCCPPRGPTPPTPTTATITGRSN